MDSIQEQVVKKVASAMLSITVANGYQNTIASVQRFRASGIDLTTLPTILVKEGNNDADLTKSSHQRIRRDMELFLVVAYRHDEEVDPRSGGEILNSLTADIERRLGASQHWDGMVLMTEPPSYLEMEVDAETPHLARGLRTVITYEHVRDDPFSQ
jgi:hypothetical protein